MMRFNWSGWFRAVNAKLYSNSFMTRCVIEWSNVRNRAGVLLTITRSADDMIYLRTSFKHISERTLCLIDLLWRYYWIMSPWAIAFNDIEKRNLNEIFEHRMNSNRSKTICPKFCRIACYFEVSFVKMTDFSLLWNFFL